MNTPHNAKTGEAYTGGNQTTLATMPFTSPTWATYLQWKELGYQVKKGQRGTRLARVLEYTDEKGKTTRRARTFVVFNREQVDMVTAPFTKEEPAIA